MAHCRADLAFLDPPYNVHIGGVVGLMPLTGLTLPFVSFGGSSLLVMMAAGGLLLNVARTAR